VIRVSVLVPAYNEAATIVQLLREVRAQKVEGVEFEVVVIDDGSNDNTVALLEQNPSLFDKLVKQARNAGKGAAVIAGLKQATGQYILFQDADLEYSPSHYDLMLMPVKSFGAEIVMGSRFAAPRYTRVQYFSHKIGNRLITLIFTTTSRSPTSIRAICFLNASLSIPTSWSPLAGSSRPRYWAGPCGGRRLYTRWPSATTDAALRRARRSWAGIPLPSSL
jgi:glycosyltransferase involved in cell wall biosynthesis